MLITTHTPTELAANPAMSLPPDFSQANIYGTASPFLHSLIDFETEHENEEYRATYKQFIGDFQNNTKPFHVTSS